jgi:hypothetical protein
MKKLFLFVSILVFAKSFGQECAQNLELNEIDKFKGVALV